MEELPSTLTTAAEASWKASAGEPEERRGRRSLASPGGKSAGAGACVPTNFWHQCQESPACDLVSSLGARFLAALGRPWL